MTSIKLDYELFQSCTFQVKASLLLPQPSPAISAAMAAAATEAAATPATTIVVVHVGNVNDNAPSIELVTSGSTVKAGSPEGTVVAQLKVGDLDDESAGLNDSVNCSVDSFRLFQLQPTPFLLPPPRHHHRQYDLITSGAFPLQRFSSSVLSINIFCSDSGGIITKQQLRIEVIRRAPAFRNGSLLLSLEGSRLEPGKVLLERLDISPGDSDATVFSIKAHDERHRRMLEIIPESKMLSISRSYRGDFEAGLYGFNITVADAVDSSLNDTLVFQLLVESSTTKFPTTPLIQVNSRTASGTMLPVSTPFYIDINNKNNSYNNSNDDNNNDHYSRTNDDGKRNNTDYPKDILSGNATPPNLATPSHNNNSVINNDDKNIIIIITAIACGTLVIIIIIIAAVIVLISRYKARKGLTAMPSTKVSTASPLRPIPLGCNHAEEDEGLAMSGDISPATVEVSEL